MCLENKKNESEYSERTLKNQRFDLRLIERIVKLGEQGFNGEDVEVDCSYDSSAKTVMPPFTT